jgi:hypothetical protein
LEIEFRQGELMKYQRSLAILAALTTGSAGPSVALGRTAPNAMAVAACDHCVAYDGAGGVGDPIIVDWDMAMDEVYGGQCEDPQCDHEPCVYLGTLWVYNISTGNVHIGLPQGGGFTIPPAVPPALPAPIGIDIDLQIECKPSTDMTVEVTASQGSNAGLYEFICRKCR